MNNPNRPKSKPAPDTRGPLLTTMIAAAAEQIADVAAMKAANLLQDFLHGLCFDDDVVLAAGDLPAWRSVVNGLQELIREAWAADAVRIEASMRENGADPEAIAGLKVPAGVVPS
jgi:hypothetical protein